MDILVSDNWLRDFLKTSATPRNIARYLSLSGPSVDRIEKRDGDFIYQTEITTNRVDSASIYGVAREAAAILPRFNIKAKLVPPKIKSTGNFVGNVKYLDVKVDHKLCPRFAAILIKNVKIKPSPDHIKKRLIAVGERPINNIVDISNYIMHELGQPTHTFDYDKITDAKMVLRASRKSEKIVTLDNKTHTLPGGDIVIEDGSKRLIDLAGIMGGLNSAIDSNTKNVLFFVQTYNPVNVRKTYMRLAHRTEAAAIFEKDLDPELVSLGIKRGIDLFVELTGGKPESQILDIYPKPYKTKKVITSLPFIEERLGVSLSKKDISKFLNSLGFKTSWKGQKLETLVPSYRSNDIEIAEDIIEEIARIYGYHKLPSELMTGSIPDPLPDALFTFEQKIKNLLSGWGGAEVYTLSMVSKDQAGNGALKLKNPLGEESSYMRTSLKPSLIRVVEDNSGEKNPFHIFEIANVYLPRKNKLPDERMILAGIFANTKYREAKGIIESLLEKLSTDVNYIAEDNKGFLASKRISIKSRNKKIGEFGILEENYIYYEFDTELLREESLSVSSYRPLPKYPAQIEDLTLILPSKTKVGDIITFINKADERVVRIELTDIFKNAYTFRVWYQHSEKTLNNEEVEEIRTKILDGLKEKFGVVSKD